MLEVIDKGSASESHPVPLLLVHGGWHGAWCWDEHFLDFFADKGYRAVALSLRNRGNSPAVKRIPKVKGSRRTGVDTLKRNDPIQHERGLTVLMRRTASGVPDHSRIHLRVCGTRVDFA
ncbi:MAG TPA: alpha/beta fold hydrolase [Steroidobacteraceae bacterium]|nr:alpha/beta fold hydrolase [Steroidobacteraceae bacterium]